MHTKRSVMLAAAFFLLLTLIPTTIAQDLTTYVTAQRFEHGLMIWRSDNSTIYALGDNGQALTFPVNRYAALPDNPIPGGALRPILGMGRVWGNNRNVRDMLGDAVLPEIGFNTSINVQNATIFITELDQTVLQLNPNGTWVRNIPSVIVPPPEPCLSPLFFDETTVTSTCPSPAIEMGAAYQPFERGFMVWLGNGDVWVFMDAPSAGVMNRYLHVELASYVNLPDSTATTPPRGLIQPVNAFGRVWGSLLDGAGRPLRDSLGWATSAETPYTATYQLHGMTSHVHQYLSLPDGAVVDAYSGLAGINWTVVAG